MMPSLSRRTFVQQTTAVAIGCGLTRAAPVESELDDQAVSALIEPHRPSKGGKLPADFCDRVGATHVGGKYCLTKEPFLVEGARKLIELGTRLGKFWFAPDRIAESYPFNSQWTACKNFVELARTDYFQEVFAMPFKTIALEAHSPVERIWRTAKADEAFLQEVEGEVYELTAYLLRTFADREITFLLQNWEGDWMLRGSDKKWQPPPADWKAVCERMQRWLAARQRGVNRARAEYAGKSRCIVAHAAEVNLVADGFKGIPTMTREVLPAVELDLVSYSCYDALHRGPAHFWKCLAEIRKHARTGPLYGKGALSIGEIGFPENKGKAKRPIAEMWDEWLGVLLAADARFIIHWELYCNEFDSAAGSPPTPITDPDLMRGYWLVRPDGSLSESGRLLAGLWQRGR